MAELTEYEQMYFNLGTALSLWQDVELGLFEVFKRVSKCRDPYIASAIFYSIISFEAKLTMTNAAAFFAVKKKILRSEWTTLAGRTQDNAKVRNRLAHFRITQPGKNPKAKYRVFLTTNAFDTTHFMKSPDEKPPTFNHEQVSNFGKQFTMLSTDLIVFAEKL
jgi:hypothetical protein